MKNSLIICFLFCMFALGAQDSVKVVTGLAVGVSSGFNKTFMGFYFGNQDTVNGTFYSKAKDAPPIKPLVALQAELYSGAKKYACKVGLAAIYYQSEYRYTQSRHYSGIGYSYSEVGQVDVKQSVLVEQLRISFFRKFNKFNIGIGITGSAELGRRIEGREKSYKDVYIEGNPDESGYYSYEGPVRNYYPQSKHTYASFALIAEVPIEKINSEITFRYDRCLLFQQHFVLLGFNKKFIWNTKVK